MKKKLIQIISAAMCVSLMATSIALYSPTKADAAAGSANVPSSESAKEKIARLEKEIEESDKKIEKYQKDKESELKIVDELSRQLTKISDQCEAVEKQKATVTAEIRTVEAKIATLSKEINALDEDISKKDEEIDATVELFCKRMRANYISGGSSTLEFFVGSSSVSDLLNRFELFKRVTQSDQKLVDTLNEEISSIEEMKKKIDEKKKALEAEKQTLVDKKNELQKTIDELTKTQNEIKAKSAVVNKKVADLNLATSREEDTKEEIDNLIKDIIKKEAAKGTTTTTTNKPSTTKKGQTTTTTKASSKPNSSGWIWPLPYPESYVTSSYGYRSDPISGATKFHSGIDISMSGAYGKNLVAVRSGTVIYTGYMSGGYGNYIIIDHGDGFSSLYAHCAELKASYGQHVEQGQVIALLGSTGYSTGPHVHFEIRYNGEKVNPLNYVSK